MVHGIIYSKKYKYVLMYSAKSGCSTIKRFFNLIHSNPSAITEYTGNNITYIPRNITEISVPKIMLVRNPYFRVVSMFTNKFISDKRGPLIRMSFIKNGIPVRPFTFFGFLNKLLDLKKAGKLESIDCHIQSQVHNLEINKNIRFVKLENIKEDIKEVYKNHIKNKELYNIVLDNLNFLDNEYNKTSINQLNKNVTYERYTSDTNIFPEYCHFYDQKAADLVYRIYKNDFIRFGYSKDSYPKCIQYKEQTIFKNMDRVLDERELCDLECLSIGAFQPLVSYMTHKQYNDCVNTMVINDGDVFPMPIVLSMKEVVEVGRVFSLKSVTGVIHAVLTVKECWVPDIVDECVKVFGVYDTNHPYTKYLNEKKVGAYVSGELVMINTKFHVNFGEYRKTPAELRACGPWVGFQTRNPLHRSHIELIKKATSVGARILLHPVEGVTQECDIPFPVRMQCYKEVMPYLGDVVLSILPLSMRMAGPREAVWHAVIRRNYGCTHFIVGRDHAGPSYKKADGSAFYEPLEAQRLAKSLEKQIGITILASEEVVYCEDVGKYMGLSESAGHSVKNISGTQFRAMLDSGADVPEWYSYSKVVDSLRAYYNKPRGSCFYFVGLSGSGKSTLAEALKGYLEESFPCKEVTVLDADIIRTHLSKGLGFSREDRSMNVRRIGYVASEIVRHGGIVLVANIAPFEEDRAWNRKLISQYGNYVEYFVDTPIDVCEERDVKGLYKAARAGTLKNFTGVSDPFEIPVSSVVVPLMSMEDSVEFVCKHALSVL